MALIYPQNGDLTKSLKSARKKVPQSALLSAGGGVQLLFGQCPNRGGANLKGASLSATKKVPTCSEEDADKGGRFPSIPSRSIPGI